MVFQDYALWPHMTVAQNIAFRLRLRRLSRRPARRARRRGAGARPPGGARHALPRPTLRRATAARGHRPRPGDPPAPAPARRTALQPRRRAARGDARRAGPPAQSAGDHRGLRHARPHRGPGHGRRDRGDARRASGADRRAGGPVRAAGQHLHRRFPGRGQLRAGRGTARPDEASAIVRCGDLRLRGVAHSAADGRGWRRCGPKTGCCTRSRPPTTTGICCAARLSTASSWADTGVTSSPWPRTIPFRCSHRGAPRPRRSGCISP